MSMPDSRYVKVFDCQFGETASRAANDTPTQSGLRLMAQAKPSLKI